ncbi:MAG: glycosyltransferase [Patescibacteria group bacterium]
MEKNNRKNIAIVINSLRLGGGAERVAATIGSELNRRGYPVHFLVFKDAENKYEYCGNYVNIGEGIKIKNSFSAFLAIFRRARRIKKYCKQNDISIAIGFMEEANFAIIISKRVFGNKAKIIASIRNNPAFKKTGARKIIKFLYPKADKVIANSRKVEQILRDDFGINNTSTIYNPINMDKISQLKDEPLPPQEQEIFDSGSVFINIGRLHEQKGQKYLIRAFKQVVDHKKDSKLVIIGEGELKNELHNLIRELNLENNVFLLGRKDNVYKYLARSNCFVLSSLWEGLPNTLIEALAVGLPAISTDCPTGPREIIAPELSVKEDINYPYRNNRGILLPTFNTGEEQDNEKKLGQEMIRVADSEIKKKEIDLKDFKLDSIIGQWEEIIK